MNLYLLDKKISEAEETGSWVKKVIAKGNFEKADKRWMTILEISVPIIAVVAFLITGKIVY